MNQLHDSTQLNVWLVYHRRHEDRSTLNVAAKKPEEEAKKPWKMMRQTADEENDVIDSDEDGD